MISLDHRSFIKGKLIPRPSWLLATRGTTYFCHSRKNGTEYPWSTLQSAAAFGGCFPPRVGMDVNRLSPKCSVVSVRSRKLSGDPPNLGRRVHDCPRRTRWPPFFVRSICFCDSARALRTRMVRVNADSPRGAYCRLVRLTPMNQLSLLGRPLLCWRTTAGCTVAVEFAAEADALRS